MLKQSHKAPKSKRIYQFCTSQYALYVILVSFVAQMTSSLSHIQKVNVVRNKAIAEARPMIYPNLSSTLHLLNNNWDAIVLLTETE